MVCPRCLELEAHFIEQIGDLDLVQCISCGFYHYPQLWDEDALLLMLKEKEMLELIAMHDKLKNLTDDEKEEMRELMKRPLNAH